MGPNVYQVDYQPTNVWGITTNWVIYHRFEKYSVVKKPRLSGIMKHGCTQTIFTL